MDELKDYVVSLELAKRMKKLGWKKRTIFCWYIKDFFLDNLPITIVKPTEIVSCQPDKNEINEHFKCYYAPLFAEIWKELPKEVPYDNDNYLYLDKHEENINERKDSISCLGYQSMELRSTLIEEKCNKNPVEAAGELWCWHREYDQEED